MNDRVENIDKREIVMKLETAIKNFDNLAYGQKETIETIGHILSGEYVSELESRYDFVNRTLKIKPGHYRKTYGYDPLSTVWSMAYYIGTIVDDAKEVSWDFGYSDINAGVENYQIPKGTLFFEKTDFADGEVVVDISLAGNDAHIDLYVSKDSTINLSKAYEKLLSLANEVSYYRGWALMCETGRDGFYVKQIQTEPVSRDKLFYREEVWNAIDKNMEILYSKNKLMRDLNLDTRRGLLLYGPPGTGKSALTTTIINERGEGVTALIVTPKVATTDLREVYEFASKMGKCIVVLEDIDMYLGNRATNMSMALPDFLNILDGVSKYNDIVTIGTTNEPDVLDPAAMRSARFDVIIHVDYPNKDAQRSIFTKYLGPHAEDVNVDSLIQVIPGAVSGADIREMIRHTVLNEDDLTTHTIMQTIKNGRWKAKEPIGFFL